MFNGYFFLARLVQYLPTAISTSYGNNYHIVSEREFNLMLQPSIYLVGQFCQSGFGILSCQRTVDITQL